MRYDKLLVWQKSMQLTELTYILMKKLPKEETYGLAGQMRRAAVSIPSNIAEGSGRSTDNDLRHFMAIARGSARELETQYMICEMLGYLNSEDIERALALLDEIGRMLFPLVKNGRVD